MVLSLLALFAGSNLFGAYFIARERYIYFWDYANYWFKYQDLGATMRHSPGAAVLSVVRSLRRDDYNSLQAIPLTSFYLLFGGDRLPFIAATVTVYLFPAALLLALVVLRLRDASSHQDRIRTLLLTMLSFLLLPAVWVPVLLGYPDVAGVVVIAAILLIYCSRPLIEQTRPALIALALLLALLILVRRWYAFWVVAFFVGAAAELLTTTPPRPVVHASLLVAARRLLGLGALAVAVFFVVATPVAMHMVSNPYAHAYSAYKSTGFAPANAARFLLTYLGFFTSSLFLIALIYGLRRQRYRTVLVFLSVQLVTNVILFTRVQDLNPHHVYLLVPTIVIVIGLALTDLLDRVPRRFVRWGALAGYVVVSAVQFTLVFVPVPSEYADAAAPFVSRHRHYPLKRDDLGELQRLVGLVVALLKGNTEEVYVLASSTVLSDDIVRNACQQFGHARDVCLRIVPTSHVDKRDGLRDSLFTARYVVAASPIQYHLRAEDQRVVGIPARAVLEGRAIGAAFRRLGGDYVLDRGVRAAVYEKARPITAGEAESIRSELWDLSPN